MQPARIMGVASRAARCSSGSADGLSGSTRGPRPASVASERSMSSCYSSESPTSVPKVTLLGPDDLLSQAILRRWLRGEWERDAEPRAQTLGGFAHGQVHLPFRASDPVRVGIAIARDPLRRSERALLTHPTPTSARFPGPESGARGFGLLDPASRDVPTLFICSKWTYDSQ
jgi:hypothetical protein